MDDDELLRLLARCPHGEYLAELHDDECVLLRISEGSPPDSVEDPAAARTLLPLMT